MIRLFLTVSFIPCLIGLLLFIDSYNTKMAADAAYNEIAFYRALPTLITKNDRIPLGRFYNSSIPEKNPFISGHIYGDYYKDRISTRYVSVKIDKIIPPAVEISAVIDARGRQ